jgi:hypothetical protein
MKKKYVYLILIFIMLIVLVCITGGDRDADLEKAKKCISINLNHCDKTPQVDVTNNCDQKVEFSTLRVNVFTTQGGNKTDSDTNYFQDLRVGETTEVFFSLWRGKVNYCEVEIVNAVFLP